MNMSLTGFGPTLGVLELTEEDEENIEDKLDDLIGTPMEYLTSCPDYPALAQKTGHYVFVYDGLKSGFARDKHLADYVPLAVGYTKAYVRLYRTTSVIPQAIAMISSDKERAAPIYGEVYMVSPETVRELDWLYANTMQTKRIRTAIQGIVDSKGTTKQIYAYMWLNLGSYWHNRMDRLIDCDLLIANNNKKPYYNFMKKYENQSNAA